MSKPEIPGYTFGERSVPDAPIEMDEFERLKQSVMFSDEDDRYLRMAGEVLDGQIDEILDLWYGFVADHDFLLYYFTDGQGNPNEEYLERVRDRFGQWIRDTCDTPYGRDWLDYQFEIARRHHRTEKNQTDEVDAVPNIDLRYVIGFIYPITATIRTFLENSGYSDADVDKMYHAWFKSVTLQVSIWSYPYTTDDDW